MDPSSEAFATKGAFVGGDVHRETADQTKDDHFFDNDAAERCISEVLYNLKSSS